MRITVGPSNRRIVRGGVGATVALAVFLACFWTYKISAHTASAVDRSILNEAVESPAALKTLEALRPLSFEPNHGLLSSRVKYIARAPGFNLLVTDKEVALALPGRPRLAHRRAVMPKLPASAYQDRLVRIRPIGADGARDIEGADRLAGHVNYFIGNDPAKWQSDIPTFGKVVQHSLWPGVDVVWHGNNRQLECDFVLAPRASPQSIGFAFDGARQLELEHDGSLDVHIDDRTLKFQKPIVYQQIGNARREGT